MPTYEYICDKCNQQFEIYQSITDKPLTVCPKEKCPAKLWGKGKIKRMITAGAGLIFKGSGFYITDYRSKEYKEAAKKEAAPPAASASGGETKSAGSSSKTESTAPKSSTTKNESGPKK